MNEDNYQGGAGGGISGARRLVYDKASNSWIGGGGGTGPPRPAIGVGGGGGGGANVPVAPERTEPYYPPHPDGPIPVDLPASNENSAPDAWILTAAGNVFLCSSIGDLESLESVAGTSGYLDSLTLLNVTDEQRVAILAGVRAWLARQDATDGA